MRNYLRKYIVDNKEIDGVLRYYRTDEEIRNDLSTKKYEIGKEFLDWLHKYEYLWMDYKYVENYLITPLKNDYTRIEYKEKPTSEQQALFLNVTQSMFVDDAFRMANGLNIIKTTYGDTGSGKSRLSINDAFLVHEFNRDVLGRDVSFTKDNICFSRQEHLDLIPKLKKGESAILDEDNEAILGIGSFSAKAFIDRYEKTLRSLSKNFWNNSPNLTPHNEHWIMKSVGINDIFGINKAIVRERENLFYGSVLFPNHKGQEFESFLSDYEDKKRAFQKQLEERTGDEARIKRVLEMAVATIQKWKLNIKMKANFKSFITTDYKVSIHDCHEIGNFITILLDERIDMFKEYKERVKEFVIPVKKKGVEM